MRRSLIVDADVILSLDWIDLGGTLRQACNGELPRGKIIQCSLDQYVHNGWNMDYQAVPPADLSVLAAPDAMVAALARCARPRAPRRRSSRGSRPPRKARRRRAILRRRGDAIGMPLADLARVTMETLARASSFVYPAAARLARASSAASSIRSTTSASMAAAVSAPGPGMAVGAALALRGGDRLPVAVLGDGDYLMGLTALWTGVHYRIPVLIIIANNESFFNDELHQERMARVRGRPVENRWIGLRMSDPAMDLAGLARDQGAKGYGPVRTVDALAAAIAQAWPTCGRAPWR